MPNSINTNIAALAAQANIARAADLSNSSVQRLSSGNRIVKASDDVAALSIGTSLQTQVSALKAALISVAQGGSLLQVADGGLAQIQSVLQQQQSLALQAASGSLTDTDRGFLNQQFQALTSQIDLLTKTTTFNSVKLLDGSIATGGSNNPLRVVALVTGGTALATQATITGTTLAGNITAVGFVQATAANGITGTRADTAFVGDLSQGVFSVTAAGTSNIYSVSYTINGQTYSSSVNTEDLNASHINLINTNATAATSSAGMIDITMSADDISGTYNGAAGALLLKGHLETLFSGATAYAIHNVATTLATDSNGHEIAGSGIQATDTNGSLLQGFTGAKITVSSTKFDGTSLPPLSNFAVQSFGASAVFSVVVNGETYTQDKTVTAIGSPTAVNGITGIGGTGIIQLYKNGDATSKEFVKLDFSTVLANVLITTQKDANQFVDAVNTLVGSGGAAGGLSFQLGSDASASVAVNIGSAKTSALFGGAALDISTQGGAATANVAVTAAIATLSSLRAGVGALQSRFDFASAALQSAVSNQDAARSQLLETDIAAESTAFATQQVKLQAGISVLAQANQQLQSLLKLIG